MKHLLLIAAVVLLTACGGEKIQGTTRIQPGEHQTCHDSTIKQRADFTLQCIGNANPNSDEEPEDWIGMCQEMAKSTYCKTDVRTLTQVCEQGIGGTCHKWVTVSADDYKPKTPAPKGGE